MKYQPLVLAALLAACSSAPPAETGVGTPSEPTFASISPTVQKELQAPKRVIFFIGDGMGMQYVTAGAYANGGPLNMMSMPHASYLKTHEYEFPITDSAASATAFATGQKAHYEGVGVRPGTTAADETKTENHLKTVLDWAKESGLKTGLVATSRIVHATPAAFAAHRANRGSYEGIAKDMSTSGVDLLMGAGAQYFEKRKDGENLLEAMKGAGYEIVRTPEELAKATSASRVVALFHDKDMPKASDGSRALSLSGMVDQAINVLDRDNPRGWFLVVEGSMIDWCGHDLDAACALSEVLDMDDAVGTALDYSRKRDDTLVAVTADHETGGLVAMDPKYTGRFTKILGGEEKAASSLLLPGKDASESPDPVMHFPLGARSTERLYEASAKPAPWGMDELADARLSLTWGFLSLASRPLQNPETPFYAAHTLTMVPLFAEGPGADFITTVRDNADLGQAMIAMVRSHSDTSPTTLSYAAPNPEDSRPKNIILMVGDGMGPNIMAAAHYSHGELAMSQLPVQGYATTHGLDCLVNDSAAAATALATGTRTRMRSTGMIVENGNFVPGLSIVDRAEARGFQTGLVSTTQLTHATPGAFFADVDHRKKRDEIAAHFVDYRERNSGSDGIEVVLTGGAADFTPEMRAALTAEGYEVRDTWSAEPSENNLVTFISDQGLPAASERAEPGGLPTLAEMTGLALTQLTRDEAPFFLLVEGGQIDWRLHDAVHDESVLHEVKDFDDAVLAAKEFAEKRGDTLVIVTADHDHTISVLDSHYIFAEKVCGAAERCGGTWKATEIPVASEKIHRAEGFSASALQGEYTDPKIILQYAWPVEAARQLVSVDAPHSAGMVPVFAFGPWATRLSGYTDQPDIGKLLHAWAE